jgi:hypothetical protein
VAAKQIVQQFGADTLKILEEQPDRLIEVRLVQDLHMAVLS